jgi:hypothetical protein
VAKIIRKIKGFERFPVRHKTAARCDRWKNHRENELLRIAIAMT